jgi:hypothetical protein
MEWEWTGRARASIDSMLLESSCPLERKAIEEKSGDFVSNIVFFLCKSQV